MEEFMLEDLRRSVKEKEPSKAGKAGRERRLDVSQLIGVTSKGYQAVNICKLRNIERVTPCDLPKPNAQDGILFTV